MVGRQAGSERGRRRTLAAFYGMGAVLCLLTGLTPGWAASGQSAALVTAGLAGAASLVLLFSSSLSLPVAHLLVVAGSGLIAGLTALSGGGAASVSYAMFAMWVSTYAFLYFSAQAAWLQSVGVLTAITVAQGHVYPWSQACVNVAMVAGVALTAGCVTKILADRLTRIAATDPLTGLLTENGLLAEGRRSAAPIQAVLLIEVDNFAGIKAAVGTPGRDELLQSLAMRLRRTVDEAFPIARLTGDVFAVVLMGAREAGSGDVAGQAAMIRDHAAGIYRMQGLDVDVAVTLGVACNDSDGAAEQHQLPTLLVRATQALAAAADEGRSVRVWTPELAMDAAAQLSLSIDLRRAVAAGELVLHYQPQVNAHSHALVGVEALVRWQHRDRGLLGPAEFLSVAEAGPIIVDLTYWVLDDAIWQAAAWFHGGHELPISVNLSPRLLVHEGLVDHVSAVLSKHGLPARLLTLDGTETAVLTQPDRSREVLASLRTLGVKISLDDFGTGYTSLAMLTDLPLDEIKLDRQFVSGVLHQVADAAIAQAVASLGRRMDLHLVAEGIEDEPTGRLLAQWGYHTVQGFLHSRPVPADQIGRLLTAAPHRADPPPPIHEITREQARLAELRRLAVDLNGDPFLEHITVLAAEVCGAKIALVSLVDADEQTFPAERGLGVNSTARSVSFCAHTITSADMLIVSDATTDPRFTGNPLVTGYPNIRHYAGAPLITSAGHVLGAVCVIDDTPRTLTDGQLNALRSLADMTIRYLEQRPTHNTPLTAARPENGSSLPSADSVLHVG